MSTQTRHRSRSATRSTRSDKPATRRSAVALRSAAMGCALRSAATGIARGPEVFAHYTLGSMVLLVNMVRFGAQLREDPQA